MTAKTTISGNLPPGVEVFRLTGPFFFGVAGQLLETLRGLGQAPRIIILRMRLVPLLDASGARALEEFVELAESLGIEIILSGVQPQPRSLLEKANIGSANGRVHYTRDFASALAMAEAREEI